MTLLVISSIAGLAAVTERDRQGIVAENLSAGVRAQKPAEGYSRTPLPMVPRSVTAASSALVSDTSTTDRGRSPASAGADTCRSARKALRYYRGVAASWWRKMGAGEDDGRNVGRPVAPGPCPRYLAHVWQRKARAARAEYGSWYAYHWDWRSWLPDKWQRIGACETGYGRRPGNWRHHNSGYSGAFGFAHSSWTAFVPYASRKAAPYPSVAALATPRQQYEVALAIWRRYGFSGWGCRGA